MASLEHISRVVAELPDGELRQICADVVGVVAGKLLAGSAKNAGFWTIGSIAERLGTDARNPSLVRGLQLLVTLRDAQLLEVHYIYFDPSGVHPEGQRVDDDAVASAYESGSFEDPETGELIENFEECLEPFFVPAASLEIR